MRHKEIPSYERLKTDYNRLTGLRAKIPAVVKQRTDTIGISGHSILSETQALDQPGFDNAALLENISRLGGRIHAASDSRARLERALPLLDSRIAETKTEIVADLKAAGEISPLILEDWEQYYGVYLDEQIQRRFEFYKERYPEIFKAEPNLLENLKPHVEEVSEKYPSHPTVKRIDNVFDLKAIYLDALHEKKIISVLFLDDEPVVGKRDVLLALYFRGRDLSELSFTEEEVFHLRRVAESLITDLEGPARDFRMAAFTPKRTAQEKVN